MEKVDVVIVGAGVIGLAIADKISRDNKNIVVIEKHSSFGQESSSRNSEVIHSGLYYPKNSLKAKFCLRGKELLYKLCESQNIPHRRIGKLIVATNNKETSELERLLNQGKDNGVQDLKLLTKDELKKIEPNVCGICALHSPSTGILDTHKLMKYLETQAKNKGVTFAYGCEVIGVEKKKNGYKINIRSFYQ